VFLYYLLNKNIFFEFDKLKYFGKNSIIGKTVRIRHPELCTIGDNSIIDDFTYISTKIEVGDYVHMASNNTIGGGKDFLFKIGSFSGISSGVRIYCSGNLFEKSIISAAVPVEFQDNISGNVIMEEFTGIGANAVILPNVTLQEGSAVGALSIVLPNQKLEKWTLYAGIPAKPIKKRDKANILEKYEKFKNQKK